MRKSSLYPEKPGSTQDRLELPRRDDGEVQLATALKDGDRQGQVMPVGNQGLGGKEPAALGTRRRVAGRSRV